MIYVLDTDVLSNLLKRIPSKPLIAKLAQAPVTQQCTTSITVGEVIYGASRAMARTNTLLAQIEGVLLPNLPILPFDRAAARQYGALRAELERQGAPLAEADLRIAAITLANGCTLVTGNERHFQRIVDLPIENWLVE
ncbi:MAG: PIN domain-containing protein [Chloroflexota bacterium]|nr:PIN domain-containing protein [Chloroflexota bacterium]